MSSPAGGPARPGSHRRPPPSLARANAAVALGTLASRVTGFGRLAALAYALDLSRLADAYNLANNSPNIVYELLLGGILTASLVPLFVEHHERGDDEATSALVTVASVALVGLTVAAVLAAPLIVRLYTAQVDGAGAGEVRAVATDLARFFLPQVLFYGLTALGTALLNARRHFGPPAFAPVLNNLVVIAALVAVRQLFDGALTVERARAEGALVWWLGLGTTAGIVAMTVALVPALRAAGVRLRWRFAPGHPAVRELVRLSGWSVGYVAANQVALAVVSVLALRDEGSYSAYQAAFVLFQLPHGLFAVSVMTTFAPGLARSASRRDWDAFRGRFLVGWRVVALVVVPAAAGYVALARPLVAVLLERGAFSEASSARTAHVLMAMAAGLAGFSLYLFTLRAFYSLKDTRTPFWLNLAENAANVVLAVALVGRHGVVGLAWAYALAYLGAAAVAYGALHRRVGGLRPAAALDTIGRALLAAEAMAVVVWAVSRGVGGTSGAGAWAGTAAGVVVGIPAYGALLVALRTPAAAAFAGRLRTPDARRVPGPR